MKQPLIIFTLIGLLYSSSSFCEEYFGKYMGTVQVEWLDEGRKMRLLSDFSFEDPNGLVWSAKKNQMVDGASIPSSLWSFVGSPFSGKYRDASVIHDIACDEKTRTWEVVHLAFYYAMRASGVSELRSKIMYGAVYHFGPRWPISQRFLVEEPTTKKIVIPAEYKMVSEKVQIKPAHKEWETEANILGFGKKEVLIDVPAEYQTITKRIMVSPEKIEEAIVPAKYEVIDMVPPPKYLNESGFKKLIAKLEALEQDGKSVSLSEIRDFH